MSCIKCGKKTNQKTKNKSLCREHRKELEEQRNSILLEMDKRQYPEKFKESISIAFILHLWESKTSVKKLFKELDKLNKQYVEAREEQRKGFIEALKKKGVQIEE